MPTSTRLASHMTSLACSEAMTRAASAGDTSVTISISPSVEMQSSSASAGERSEEHTSELQSLTNLVCRLLLEKKKKSSTIIHAKDTSHPYSVCSVETL